MKPRRRAFRFLAAAGLAALMFTGPACGRPDTAGGAGARVLLIGLDAAEWNLLRPMLAAGELPNLKRLIDRGISGDLRSLEPLQKSPAIWTTIATGRAPEEHGIRSFVDMKGGQPLTRNIRRVKALWNILSTAGRSVGLVGWLMSWPAEEVNGFVVSDYVQYQAGRSARLEHRTWPPELYDEIAPLNRDWRDLPWSEVGRFHAAPVDEHGPDSALVRKIQPIRWMISADLSFADIALKLGGERKPDLMAVYLRSMDTMAHLFWNYQSPESHPPGAVEPAWVPYFKDTMRREYRWMDEQVGRLLTLADSKTTVVICSDHGFIGGGGGGIREHRVEGVLIMAGPHVARGELTGATVYDITPTVLALFGLPKADDMRGKVLWGAFDATIRPDKFARSLPTYETGPAGEGTGAVASPVDKELMERLRSLGYIK